MDVILHLAADPADPKAVVVTVTSKYQPSVDTPRVQRAGRAAREALETQFANAGTVVVR